jgi:hypothetical protein
MLENLVQAIEEKIGVAGQFVKDKFEGRSPESKSPEELKTTGNDDFDGTSSGTGYKFQPRRIL